MMVKSVLYQDGMAFAVRYRFQKSSFTYFVDVINQCFGTYGGIHTSKRKQLTSFRAGKVTFKSQNLKLLPFGSNYLQTDAGIPRSSTVQDVLKNTVALLHKLVKMDIIICMTVQHYFVDDSPNSLED